jgi:predicted extracellular nuclease
MLAAGQHYLIQGGGGLNGVALPTPDLIDSKPIAMNATSGKVALVNSQVSLGCNGVSTPCTPEQMALIVDLVGYGDANFFEGLDATPILSSITAAIRQEGGCTDTDDNAADFDVLAPTPRNTFSLTNSCGPAEIFPTDLFFSEYIEGSGNNKALEIYNGTGVDVDLKNYQILHYKDGATSPTYTYLLTGTVTAGDVYVLTTDTADPILTAAADVVLEHPSVVHFNGDDALALQKIEPLTTLDVIGQIGIDPGTSWGTDPIQTAEDTLTRKDTICEGDPDGSDPFDPADEWVGWPLNDFTHIGSHETNCFPPVEEAPEVISTVPADEAFNVAVDANIVITFSEPVTVTGDWFTISCTGSGLHTATVTDADPIFTLVPDSVFETGETCTVTVVADNVKDDDEDDELADFMEDDYIFTFNTISVCGDDFTPIYEIQGPGAASPLAGQTVTTEGVVVGDFQSGGKNGFFIQDEIGDEDATTSDGIFVYYPSAPAVNVGDKVHVTGSVSEYFELTQITGSFIQTCSTDNTIEPVELTLPFESTNHEPLEGMLVTFPQALVISEYFNFDRYGELLLTSERHSTPTAIVEPGPDAVAMAAYHELDSIAVDDGSSYQNPSVLRHPDGSAFGLDNYFRGGDTVAGLTGVMDYNFDEFKIQPVGTAVYEAVNLRTDAPELVPGEIRIASLNVLNYFTTLDGGTSEWICGPSGDMECRGADANQPLELERQQVKIVNAILGMDADIVGLMEIENEHPEQLDDEPVISLVTLLNEATEPGMYSYIATGPIGTDAIKQAILYKTEKVVAVGEFNVLDSSVDERFDTDLNRPSLVQSFEDKITGEIFTVSVNHLKSKGSDCDDFDDPDEGDGAGNCNLTRKAAAEALVEWLETDPTETGSDMYVIIGDLNSYAMEDPIDMIKLGADDLPYTDDDYYNLVERFQESDAYGYVYDGQTGYLDHALGNRKFASYVLDANFWNINADEADVFDYDTSFKPTVVDEMFDPTTPYRSSDHDPVLISLLFNHPPMAVDDEYTVDRLDVLEVAAPGVLANDFDANKYDNITVNLIKGTGPYHGTLIFNQDGSFAYTPDGDFTGVDSFEYLMMATPGLMSDYIDSATVRIMVTRSIFLPLIFR